MTAARALLVREQDIVRACLAVLRLRGVFAYRQNQGAFHPQGKNQRFVRFTSINGISDIIGVMPNGRFIAVECKRSGNVPTADQQTFLDAVNRRGGLGIVITDAADLAEILDRELGDADRRDQRGAA